MKIREVINTDVINTDGLKTQQSQVDHEARRLKNKRADLGIRKAQAAMVRAQKQKREAQKAS